MPEDLVGRSLGHHGALVERHHPIGDRTQQGHVVFDDHESTAHLVTDPSDHRCQGLSLALGNATGRLIEEHNHRTVGDHAGEVHDPAGARREFVDELGAKGPEPHRLEQFRHP